MQLIVFTAFSMTALVFLGPLLGFADLAVLGAGGLIMALARKSDLKLRMALGTLILFYCASLALRFAAVGPWLWFGIAVPVTGIFRLLDRRLWKDSFFAGVVVGFAALAVAVGAILHAGIAVAWWEWIYYLVVFSGCFGFTDVWQKHPEGTLGAGVTVLLLAGVYACAVIASFVPVIPVTGNHGTRVKGHNATSALRRILPVWEKIRETGVPVVDQWINNEIGYEFGRIGRWAECRRHLEYAGLRRYFASGRYAAMYAKCLVNSGDLDAYVRALSNGQLTGITYANSDFSRMETLLLTTGHVSALGQFYAFYARQAPLSSAGIKAPPHRQWFIRRLNEILPGRNIDHSWPDVKPGAGAWDLEDKLSVESWKIIPHRSGSSKSGRHTDSERITARVLLQVEWLCLGPMTENYIAELLRPHARTTAMSWVIGGDIPVSRRIEGERFTDIVPVPAKKGRFILKVHKAGTLRSLKVEDRGNLARFIIPEIIIRIP